MGVQKLQLDDALLKTTNKKPPFTDDMRHDTAIRFDTVTFTKENIPDNGGAFKNNGNNGMRGIFAAAPRTDNLAAATGKAAKGGAGEVLQDIAMQRKQGRTAAAAQTSGGSKALGRMRFIGRKAAQYGKSAAPDIQQERSENNGLRALDGGASVLQNAESTVRKGFPKKTSARIPIQPAAAKAMSFQTATSTAARYTTQGAAVTAKAAAAARETAVVGGKIAAATSNPIVLVVVLVIVVLLFLVLAISMSTPKTPMDTMGKDLYTEIQTYIEEKDKAVQKEFDNYEKNPEFENIKKKYITKKIDVTPSTSIDLMAAYLLAKHTNKINMDLAKSEIDAIHAALYTIKHTTAEKEENETLTVTLTGISLQEYFDKNIEVLLTPAQKKMFDWYRTNTAAHFTGKAGMPFEDEKYMSRVTQEFGIPGYFDNQPHRGMDFSYPLGTPVLSVLDGTVKDVLQHYSWGLNVVVESVNGAYRLRYAHLSAFKVSAGDSVKAGQVIGLVGSTGVSSGPHLHLEVEHNGQLVNPRILLEGKS